MKQCIQVIANIEIDAEALLNEVAAEYEVPVSDVETEDVVEFLNNHLSYLHREGSDDWRVSDGPSINGLADDVWLIADGNKSFFKQVT